MQGVEKYNMLRPDFSFIKKPHSKAFASKKSEFECETRKDIIDTIMKMKQENKVVNAGSIGIKNSFLS